jgi:hypothetical protein
LLGPDLPRGAGKRLRRERLRIDCDTEPVTLERVRATAREIGQSVKATVVEISAKVWIREGLSVRRA